MSGKEKLNRTILAIAWPAIVTNVTTPLLSLVDVAIAGRIGSAVFIGAITVGGAMFNMLYWLFGFLRAGTSGLTAQANGAGDTPECLRSLVRSLAIAAVAGVLMIAFSELISQTLLAWMDADNEASVNASQYFMCAVWGAPAVLGVYSLSGWYIGMQDSKPTLKMALVANVSNILLSATFVYVFKWGIVGLAAGTMIAQWLSLAVGLGMLIPRLRALRTCDWLIGLWHWACMKRYFKVNTDIMLRTCCLIAVTLWFTHAGAKQGVEILAANALIMQLFMLFSYFMDGFAYAGEALAGRFLGANNRTALVRTVRLLTGWGIGISLVVTLLYFVCGNWILMLLADDASVCRVAQDYRLWAVAVPMAGFMSFLWDGVFIGLTLTRRMLLSMLAAMVVFYGVYFVFFDSWHNHALWLAFISYLVVRGALQSWFWMRYIKNKL